MITALKIIEVLVFIVAALRLSGGVVCLIWALTTANVLDKVKASRACASGLIGGICALVVALVIHHYI